mgnify:FL=1
MKKDDPVTYDKTYDSAALKKQGLDKRVSDMRVRGLRRDCPVVGPYLRNLESIQAEIEGLRAQEAELMKIVPALNLAWSTLRRRYQEAGGKVDNPYG